MFSDLDKSMMKRALKLANNGIYSTTPNPRVGCVIVKDDEIIGEGYHFRAGEPHAEVFALKQAGENALKATAYVTLEPCNHFGRTPPCVDALINAGVAKVVIAMVDPNPQVAGQGIERLENAGIKVVVGLYKEEAQNLNAGFIKRMRKNLPYVQLKLASSLDGKTALANGQSKWITGDEARSDVQAFRAKSCAILSTIATVEADDPSLTVRYDELPVEIKQEIKDKELRQPLRVILDTQGRINPNAKLFTLEGDILLFTSNPDFKLNLPQLEVICLQQKDGRIDLLTVFEQLADRGINYLWVEAGATLAASLISQNLIDEILLYQAPKLMGSNARSLVDLNGFSQMDQLPEFELSDLKQIGKDIRIILRPLSIK